MKTFVWNALIIIALLVGLGSVPVAAAIGPLELHNADRTSHARLLFVGQYLLTWRDIADDDKSSDATLEFRRIRLALRAKFDEEKLTFYWQLSTAPQSLELMDLRADYSFTPRTHIAIGQSKVPFTRYRMHSFQRLTLNDWATATKYFGAERQMGITVHNGDLNPPAWGYVIGVFSGVNARAAHGIGLPIAYGTSIPNPSDLTDPGPRADIHPELFVHLSHHSGSMRLDSDSDPERGPLRYFVALSAAWDFDPEPQRDFTQRIAPELLVKYEGWSFAAVGYAGFAEIGELQQNRLAMLGALTQAAYRINTTYEIAGRYAVVDYSDDLIADIERIGHTADGTDRIQEITAGINCYVSGHSLKWQNDVSLIRTTHGCSATDEYRWRSQLQLAF